MFGERLLASLIFAPLVAGAFYFGDHYFAALILFTSAVGSYEYRRIVASAGIDVHIALIPLSSAVALTAFFESRMFVIALCAASIVILSLALIRTGTATSAMLSLSGVMYIGGLLGCLSLVRIGRKGMEWSLFVLFVTWATDVGAYLGGSALGRHRLAPKISPSKTWEGALCGTTAAALVGWILAGFLDVPALYSILGGALLGVVAELGDLTESSLKRFGNVKDSGRIMPGHGGVLDRFDSLLFAGVGGLVLRALYCFLGQ